MKTNDVILKSLSIIISGCIFLLSLSLYFGGHFLPGGGFVGGLLCTMSLALAMFTYGIDKVNRLLPINYVYVAALGLLFSVGTAFSGIVAGKNFFKHHFTHIHVPDVYKRQAPYNAPLCLSLVLMVVPVSSTIPVLTFNPPCPLLLNSKVELVIESI